MSNRMDVVSARSYEKNGEQKTAYTRIGTAWSMDSGGWRVILEALPLPQINNKGALETQLLLFPPKDNAEQPSQPARGSYSADKTKRQAPAPAFNAGYDEDPIPFSPEMRG